MHHVPGLYSAGSEIHELGVFCAHELNPGDLIECCPVILVPKKEIERVNETVFFNYYFLWPDERAEACLPLGYGSLYNHSGKPNAEIEIDLAARTLDVKCIRPIAVDEEITIDYTAGRKDGPGLWFEPVV